ncbi:glucuronate isomerase [Bacillus velezensis]
MIFRFKSSPGFRPDKGLDISDPGFADWVRSLESASGMAVTTYQSYLDALESRVRFFHNAGGKSVGSCVRSNGLCRDDRRGSGPDFCDRIKRRACVF